MPIVCTTRPVPRYRAFPNGRKDKLEQAEYVAFYPNVLLGIQADHAFAMIVEPRACDNSIEHLRLYYVGDEALNDEHAASRTATLESLAGGIW